MARHRCVAVALVALVALRLATMGADGADAARAPTTTCVRSTGDVDRNRVPRSVSDLVEQSDAVVAVRVAGKEKLLSRDGGDRGSSISFLMGSKAHIEDVFKGDVSRASPLTIHRRVLGYDLESALEQSVCANGHTQALEPGARYLIGLVADDAERWYAAAGPYSTIPLRSRKQQLVAVAAPCPVGGTDCDGFPYTLAGQTYGSLKAEVKAAAR
jgi:hypothetical protein